MAKARTANYKRRHPGRTSDPSMLGALPEEDLQVVDKCKEPD